MAEHIRYSWGRSSLGAFVAAASAQGLVAFEFADDPARGLQALRDRAPDAELTEDPEGLADLVRRLSALAEDPAAAAEIPLDPRGSAYELGVWRMLREIPAGETTSYGALAAKLGTRDARDVTAAIAANGIAILIPCHRVVKKDGSISGYRWGVRRKKALLERERQAVPFRLT